jgi:thymidylate synthase ThyX
MGYSVKILLDSISETGKRLTTFEIQFPRIVLAEFNTHRMLSRNSASSRAIPFSKQLERVIQDPFIPERFPKNGKGMQPQGYYEKDSIDHKKATDIWLKARDKAIEQAKKLVGMDEAWLEDSGNDLTSDRPQYLHIHKQIANRLFEPFQWHTVICTATEFDNFFKLRTHPDAQAEIKTIADLMYEAYHNNHCYNNRFNQCDRTHVHTQKLKVDKWHCPLVSEEDNQLVYSYLFQNGIDGDNKGVWRNAYNEIKKKISVARCARVSYLTHDGRRDIVKDLELFDRLKTSGHWSPFEHVATPFFNLVYNNASDKHGNNPEFDLQSGNFIGWKQMRKEFSDENCTDFRKN